MYQLLLILRSIAPKLYNSNHSELEDGIIAPLGDLLAGCKTSSTASIFAKMECAAIAYFMHGAPAR